MNHGTIKTPIKGREAQEVLRRVRGWAAGVGEVRVGEGPKWLADESLVAGEEAGAGTAPRSCSH